MKSKKMLVAAIVLIVLVLSGMFGFVSSAAAQGPKPPSQMDGVLQFRQGVLVISKAGEAVFLCCANVPQVAIPDGKQYVILSGTDAQVDGIQEFPGQIVVFLKNGKMAASCCQVCQAVAQVAPPPGQTPPPPTETPTLPPPPTVTPPPTEPPPTETPPPTEPPKAKCNQGVGNGSEGCDPGNSNNTQSSNDEPGKRGGGKK